MGKLTSRHRQIIQDVRRTRDQDLNFKHCLLNSYSATEARNLYKLYVKVENGCLRGSDRAAHDRCFDSFVLKFTRCKTRGVFEALSRFFAYIFTLPIDVGRALFSMSLNECFKYTRANTKAIADSFFKPQHYAKKCTLLDKTRRHSPKSKTPILKLHLNLKPKKE